MNKCSTHFSIETGQAFSYGISNNGRLGHGNSGNLSTLTLIPRFGNLIDLPSSLKNQCFVHASCGSCHTLLVNGIHCFDY
jgi:alpha-tubulin suppressor-like RCC1 family protein